MSARDFILYPIGGVLVGVGLSLAVTRARVPLPENGTALSIAAVVALGLGSVLIVKTLRRDTGDDIDAPKRVKEPRSAAAPAIVEARSNPLKLAITFPDISDGHPDVWGVGDALRVVVEAPSGASVTLATKDRKLGTASSTHGEAAFHVKWEKAADGVELVAHAELDGRAGEAKRSVDVVDYADEVERLFNAFQDWARDNFPATSDALTARELLQGLKRELGPKAEEALLEATRVFELVNYGERDANRSLYIRMVDALALVADIADRHGSGERSTYA